MKPLSQMDPTLPRLIYKHILKFCYIFLHDTFVYLHTLANINGLYLALAHTHIHTHMQKYTVSFTNTRVGVTFSHIQTSSHHQYAYVFIYITAEIVISSLVCPFTFSLNSLSLSVSVRPVWTYVQLRNQSIWQYRYVWMQTSAVCTLHKVYTRENTAWIHRTNRHVKNIDTDTTELWNGNIKKSWMCHVGVQGAHARLADGALE